MKKKTLFTVMVASVFLFGVFGCKEEKKSAPVITVRKTSSVESLYFVGRIQPQKVFPVTSIIDGVVDSMNFDYGQSVKKGQVLLHLKSEKLSENFQQALSDYLKAKEAHTADEGKWRGTEELNRLGLLSKNNYIDAATAHQENSLAYYQRREKLIAELKKTQVNVDKLMHTLDQLTLKNMIAVKKALRDNHNLLLVVAPADGVVLLPKTGDDNDKPGQRLLVGSAVKNGDVLATIGDLRGFSLQVNVHEIERSKVQVGQAVKVTGVAFPGVQLKGKVASVSAQAVKNNTGLPEFSATIVIPDVSSAVADQVHVGMSAKVEISLNHPQAIKLPLAAIDLTSTQPRVKVKQTKGGFRWVFVKVKSTTSDSAIIESGVKEGDQVLLSQPLLSHPYPKRFHLRGHRAFVD